MTLVLPLLQHAQFLLAPTVLSEVVVSTPVSSQTLDGLTRAGPMVQLEGRESRNVVSFGPYDHDIYGPE